ncbi:thioredoxin domain-containing protein [Robiginitalea marina]|uniref:Thioredoxin domain-containing protein n=1 Tax=Robiginitalea marina TaxID=2954105 RepID=A0ABT1ATL4_9FLAO|nr:thioredoxin domain-containing protein [Robiginitalea marina]MCO5723286.1 thioredoxin domain-containing protein [Robiginitalea marina]
MKHPAISLTLMGLLCCLGISCMEAPATRKNVLGEQTSPYLLQHAQNPVHWQPWSDEVWEMAKAENKLVLISIGYSSCHWCHVMEEETFEDDSVAAFMNANFINVKVDREERPDVDQVYMTAVQLMTGSGGWPLNVLALPDGKPIYGGTYHTREQWMKVLGEVNGLYRKDPEKAAEYADRVSQGVASVNLFPGNSGPDLEAAALGAAVSGWATRWDPEWGGNAGEQKFMLPPNLDFLMEYAHATGDSGVKDHLKRTLDRMALGGVFDQLGGGFYRYSTDPRWHIPHFEKMLYDNAQLLGVYARAYSFYGDPHYRGVVERTFAFLQRDLKGPGGGYYAALDADSEGEEGKFYLWGEAELRQVLGPDYNLFAEYYQVHPENAWEGGQYVLFRVDSDPEFLLQHPMPPSELAALKAGWHKKLMERRALRSFPGEDDKILTSWNAMLVASLADAYDALGDAVYLEEARSLFDFLMAHAYRDGKLGHSYKKGAPQAEGFLEDYAFMAQAAFRLYQVSLDRAYLERADEFLGHIQSRFRDEASPLFRYREVSDLMAPIVKTDDGVMPSPNTVVADLLFQLGHFYYRPADLDQSREMARTLQGRFMELPENYAGWGRILLRQQAPFYEVAVAGPDAGRLRSEMARRFLPNILLVATGEPSALPLFEQRYDPAQTRFYVCRDHSCRLPVPTVAEALGQIQGEASWLP